MKYPEKIQLTITPEDCTGHYWSNDCAIGRAIRRELNLVQQPNSSGRGTVNGVSVGRTWVGIVEATNIIARYTFNEFGPESMDRIFNTKTSEVIELHLSWQ